MQPVLSDRASDLRSQSLISAFQVAGIMGEYHQDCFYLNRKFAIAEHTKSSTKKDSPGGKQTQMEAR
jgi:hypothetical protein